jgi:hypothetical protein
LLPFRIGRRPLAAILEIAAPVDRNRYTGLSAAYIAKAVDQTTRHPWLMRDRKCLRRGLLGYRFLSEAGLRPELRFSVDPHPVGKNGMTAHCWVCLEGTPVISEDLAGATTVLVHADHGLLREDS